MATQKDFVVKNGIIVNQNITIAGKTHDRILDSADVGSVAAGEAISLAIALGQNMANTFKVKTKTNIGTADSDVYTCPSATATTVIGLNLANTTSSAVTADITLVNNDGDNVKIVKTAPISVGGALVAVGGDQKVVLEASDKLQVKSSAASSIDVTLSILEIT